MRAFTALVMVIGAGFFPRAAHSFDLGQMLQPKESADPYTETAHLCDRMGGASSEAPDKTKYGPLGPLLTKCSPQVRSNYAENMPISNGMFDKILEKLQSQKGTDATSYLKENYPLGFKMSDISDCKKYATPKASFTDLSPSLAINGLYLCSPRKAVLLVEVSERDAKAIYVLDPYTFNKLYFNNLIYGEGTMVDADRAGSRAAWYFTKDQYHGIDEYRWANTLMKRLTESLSTPIEVKNQTKDSSRKPFGIKVSWCDRKCIDDLLQALASKGLAPSFLSPGSWLAQIDGAFVISQVLKSSRADRGCLKPYDFIMTIGNNTVPKSP